MAYLVYIAAALAEIAGCFAFWAWLKLDRSPLWLVPGVLALCLFAWLLTLVEAEHAGRAYAAYGGIYILSALGWLWVAEGVKPDRWDALGVGVCLVGASIILRGTAHGVKAIIADPGSRLSCTPRCARRCRSAPSG